jgi:hypothetical protein
VTICPPNASAIASKKPIKTAMAKFHFIPGPYAAACIGTARYSSLYPYPGTLPLAP